MKCPQCNCECVRDEHPDGYAVGPWSCQNCEWSEEKPANVEIGDEDLPF